ncbi:flagellar hook-associated protein FlgK [Pseudoalteromonas sp. 68 DY56-GL68]|uniref:flagellar hook-associated protein FlgK n=1 Tax=Pseudoalteromonas sp. 68 DY56-GL68 TaxID=2974919 RepID=UPI00352A5C7F
MSMISNAMSGLNAANVAMTVAGQNVANAAVDGYSRQAASFATSNSPLGGVYVNSVDRIVDAFLNDDIWRTQSDLSYYQSKQTYLGYVEEIVGTDSLNFNDAVGQITNAFNAAASSPDSNAYRQQIISSSEGLIQDLAQMNGALSAQIDKLSLEMTNLASNTSSTAQQIADVNQNIVQAIANKQPTAELKDKREQLITELSSQIGIAITERDDGSLDISTLSGAPLVIGTSAATVSVAGTEVSTSLKGQSFTLNDQVGGKFGGLISADLQVIQPTLEKLSDLVKDFADDVNTALSEGFDLNGDAGIPLFTYNVANPLSSIEINPAITPEKIALIGGEFDAGGNWVAAGGRGDNANVANIIAAIQSNDDDFSVLVGDLGIASKQNQNSATTSEVLNSNAVLARDSRSGVNLDEEAANLLHFQQMYSANAKVITTADQVFNTLLTMF